MLISEVLFICFLRWENNSLHAHVLYSNKARGWKWTKWEQYLLFLVEQLIQWWKFSSPGTVSGLSYAFCLDWGNIPKHWVLSDTQGKPYHKNWSLHCKVEKSFIDLSCRRPIHCAVHTWEIAPLLSMRNWAQIHCINFIDLQSVQDKSPMIAWLTLVILYAPWQVFW